MDNNMNWIQKMHAYTKNYGPLEWICVVVLLILLYSVWTSA